MALIRLQNKVPNVYVDKSRDFQLLCRAYDLANNQVKFDIDSMPFILSSSQCRDNILPLLQTKLGFETSALIDGDSLRIILTGFPDIIKYKGSLTGVLRAINTWLKTIHLETVIRIDVFNVLGGPYDFIQNQGQTIGGMIGQTEIPAYTIAIGVQGNPRDYSVLKEILKYVIPTGYNLYFYFFEEFSVDESTPTVDLFDDYAVLATVTDDINSAVRSAEGEEVEHGDDDKTIQDVEELTKGKIIGSVFSVEAIGSDITDTDILKAEEIDNEE